MRELTIKNVVFGKGKPKICIPIVETTREAIINEANEIAKISCDLVEWRGDFYQDVEKKEELLETLHQLRSVLKDKVLLFTFRSIKEGGNKAIDEDQYFTINSWVAASKDVDLIDVEVFYQENMGSFIDTIHSYNVKIIGSNHDFEKTPSKDEIIRRLKNMQKQNVDICKIAVMPQSKKDVLTLLAATEEMSSSYSDRPLITMSMTQDGLISRLSGELFGSSVTFASLHKTSAPGQIQITKLEPVLELFHQEVITSKFFDYLHDDARMIRQKVFVEEQQFHNEFEDRENECIHLVLYLDDKPVGTGRMYEEGTDTFILGRIAILPNYRKKKLGSKIMQELENKASELGIKKLKLSAQVRAKGFYQTLGYQEHGEEYFDEYCPHITMLKEL